MSDFVQLSHDPLDVGRITDLVVHKSTGAVALFIGTTRDHFDGRPVLSLDYEAYESMAQKKLQDLCDQIRAKWQVMHIAIYHRLGRVLPTEASLVIAVSSQHRKESLVAVDFAIETLKATVPIWKKEVYGDDSAWKANKECPWADVQQTPSVAPPSPDPSLVQIVASKQEIDRRMDAFMKHKRAEINAANVLEFCNKRVEEEGPYSCARTDATVIRRMDSRSHLKNSSTVNPSGPQTQRPSEVSQLEEVSQVGIQERLTNLEQHLLGPARPVPKDVYSRLKLLEDRVLYLESLSPEYGSSLISQHEAADAERAKASQLEQQLQEVASINQRIQQLRTVLKQQHQ